MPQISCFAAFALAFAIKVPLFPLHTWLPDAHVEAPTGGSVILAGVLLKFGTYGFLRFALPLFPLAAAAAAPLIAILAVIGIVYGALMAYVQDDVKKLVAYSSVSHLGFVVLGILTLNPTGDPGGASSRCWRTASRPAACSSRSACSTSAATPAASPTSAACGSRCRSSRRCFLVIVLASVGLPGLCGFVGEFLILLGTFNADQDLGGQRHRRLLPPSPKLMAAISATAVILAAMYLLDDVPEGSSSARSTSPRTRPPRARTSTAARPWVFGHRGGRGAGDGRLCPQPILERSEKSVDGVRDRLP